MPEELILGSFKINGLWVSVAHDSMGQVFANSMPVEDRDAARDMAVDALRCRGIARFSERDTAQGRALAEEILKAGAEGGLKPELSFEGLTKLRREIYEFVRTVPRGRVVSYDDVAAAVGSPRAARAVGTAMACNPFPWVVPCHRVVKSDLALGGFSGLPCRKEALLSHEGVQIKDGKIKASCRLVSGK